MPLIRAQGKKRAYNPSAGNGVFKLTTFPNDQYDWSISFISMGVPGYKGPMDLIIVGASSLAGNYWSPDNAGGTMGSGQVRAVVYEAQGDETGFSLSQQSSGSTLGKMVLTIIGGVNNGKLIPVGSRRNAASYGAAGAALNYNAGDTTLPVKSSFMAASCSPYRGWIYYSDNTSYGPDVPESYGESNIVKTYNGGKRIVTLRGAAIPGGVIVKDQNGVTVVECGHSTCIVPNNFSSAITNGCVIQGYPD